MLGFGLLKSAFTKLATAISGWADTIDQVNAGMRQRLLLDVDDAAPVNRLLLSPVPPVDDGVPEEEEDTPVAANGKSATKKRK